jgi:hypothetical protein
MKKKTLSIIMLATFCLAVLSCGNDKRTYQDQTKENVSPNQTMSEEETQKKDSTWFNVTDGDSVSDNQENNKR